MWFFDGIVGQHLAGTIGHASGDIGELTHQSVDLKAMHADL